METEKEQLAEFVTVYAKKDLQKEARAAVKVGSACNGGTHRHFQKNVTWKLLIGTNGVTLKALAIDICGRTLTQRDVVVNHAL